MHFVKFNHRAKGKAHLNQCSSAFKTPKTLESKIQMNIESTHK